MILCRRFFLSRGQRVSLLGALFYLAANEDPIWYILLPRGQRGSRSTSISSDVFFYLVANEDLSLQGAFFYLAANEELLSWALSFTSRPTRISFSWALYFTSRPTRNFFSRALSFTSRPTRISFFPGAFFYLAANEYSLLITNFFSIWSLQ